MASDFLPQIDPTKCIGCDLCVGACPNQALSLVNNIADVTHPEACNYSGACQEICPTEAISLTYEIVFGHTRREEKS
jgi:formate hydrogenlyase subunit 6/NADH:ubiquinone oxidoreductase subunit I